MDLHVREECAADDGVIPFTDINDSLSIVCEVTYSMILHDSFSVLVVASYPCIKVFKQEQDVVSSCRHVVIRRQIPSAMCIRNHPCPLHLRFHWGVGHVNGEFDVSIIQIYV